MSVAEPPELRSFLSRHAVVLTVIAVGLAALIPLWFLKGAVEGNADAIDQIQEERRERISTQEAINAYVNRKNTRQDCILAALIEVSLASGPADEQLTPEQLEGKAVFENALQLLRNKATCPILGRLRPPGTKLPP